MKKQVKYLTNGMSAMFGILLLTQCTSDRTENNQTADKDQSVKEEVKDEYVEVKNDVKDAAVSDDKAGADQYDPRWNERPEDQKPKQDLKAEFADINQEFVDAFEALGKNIEEDIDHTQQKMAAARLERISKRLDSRMDKLEQQLKDANKAWEAADELVKLKAVQAKLHTQIVEVKNAPHSHWDEVRKNTRETCKQANEEITQQVGEIQGILADSK